jgi:hypothetical protein
MPTRGPTCTGREQIAGCTSCERGYRHRALPPIESAGNIAGMIEILILISAGATIAGALLGLVALYEALGMAALWLAVGLLFVLHLALQRRGVGYYDPGGAAATRQAETTGTRSAANRPIATAGAAGTEEIIFNGAATDLPSAALGAYSQPIAPPRRNLHTHCKRLAAS